METSVAVRKEAEEEAQVVAAPAETTRTEVSGSHGNSLVSEHEDDDQDDDEQQEEEQQQDEDDDESEYEYEDEDETAFGGFLSGELVASSNMGSSDAPAHILDEPEQPPSPPPEPERKTTWREPSKAAVNMSLRAERETTGGRRRLASDLYKIMMADTKEAGFSLQPQSEDSMEKWTIKLFQFDEDSNLHKDMLVLGLDHIELEMSFPDQYPFEPPFVRVVRPKFKRQTGFVMNGALCMELLTKDGWNPVNDIESVIVSIRSLLVVGDGRLAAAADMNPARREEILSSRKRAREDGSSNGTSAQEDDKKFKVSKTAVGQYSLTEAQAAYSHLSDYHKKKGWDTSGWWARKG